MDLSPFLRINPCGYQGMEMVQINDFNSGTKISSVEKTLIEELVAMLSYKQVEIITESKS
jgi:lipoyl(octanoyl) transferase